MSKKASNELTDNIEAIGPGLMLAEARVKMNLSAENVAEKLNFRVCQVKDIEADRFDKSVPETFTRGYLINYAKLVEISVDDVLSSYDALDVAKQQGSKMQSFSKITEKQAEHSRVMWLSYLIVLVLIALTIVYYFQDANNQKAVLISDIQTVRSTNNVTGKVMEPELSTEVIANTREVESDPVTIAEGPDSTNVELNIMDRSGEQGVLTEETQQRASITAPTSNVIQQEVPTNALPAVRAIFTFAGDCWVNIQDGTGERIAYGIKKAGYVMELNGVPPFNITVGKPELVAINFNGRVVDMSKYNTGNIAKFILPETPES
ncbi:RodZ domain-containing protein [Thalassotalea atypica]|uniref:RodZ domain-containing protein n=1 Tax=Thalassotalea atypica TaxID=2054316 RepID=UPI002572B64D|nr:RodZ domain-containing protein [Thalassotalea atypica]